MKASHSHLALTFGFSCHVAGIGAWVRKSKVDEAAGDAGAEAPQSESLLWQLQCASGLECSLSCQCVTCQAKERRSSSTWLGAVHEYEHR